MTKLSLMTGLLHLNISEKKLFIADFLALQF